MIDLSKERILITGAKGFVGKNLLQKLKQIGCNNIIAPDKHELNLSVQHNVEAFFSNNKPTVVFHLAGKNGGIAVNKEKMAEFYYENSIINLFTLHYSHICGAKKVVALGAGCAYSNNCEIPLKEQDYWKDFPEKSLYGYSTAKRSLAVQSMAYRQQYGFDSTVLLPANLYGPHDNFNQNSSVVPSLIAKFFNAKINNLPSVEIWGSGNATRELLYIDDAVNAIINSVNCSDSGPINLGNGVETTIKELATTISSLVHYNGTISWNIDKAEGQMRRVYDMTKFQNLFGYKPKTLLNTGLDLTIKWYSKQNNINI